MYNNKVHRSVVLTTSLVVVTALIVAAANNQPLCRETVKGMSNCSKANGLQHEDKTFGPFERFSELLKSKLLSRAVRSANETGNEVKTEEVEKKDEVAKTDEVVEADETAKTDEVAETDEAAKKDEVAEEGEYKYKIRELGTGDGREYRQMLLVSPGRYIFDRYDKAEYIRNYGAEKPQDDYFYRDTEYGDKVELESLWLHIENPFKLSDTLLRLQRTILNASLHALQR